MKEKKVLKRPTFLFIYAICIVIILVYILFLAPNSMFLSKESKKLVSELEQQDKFSTLSLQFEHLKNGEYKYIYNILDSYGNESVIYLCEGNKSALKDEGSCTKPSNFSYTQENKLSLLKGINENLIDIDYIYSLIEKEESKETTYDRDRAIEYTILLNNFKTDIKIYTNYNEITEIIIANMYETYVLKFSDIKY